MNGQKGVKGGVLIIQDKLGIFHSLAQGNEHFPDVSPTFHLPLPKSGTPTPTKVIFMNKPFHGIFHHLESGHSSWNAHSDFMETAVKLFSQVYTAQNFQVNIWYYTSFYS